MSFEIIATPRFKRDIKKLAKKYQSLKKEYTQLIEELEDNPNKGTPIGNNCFKIRVSIASKGKGKSGGVHELLLTLYSKKKLFSY